MRLAANELSGSGARYASNPEFLREGQAIQDWKHPDRIVVGVEPNDHQSVKTVRALAASSDAPCIVTDITSAEMIKYASNAFLATRISFINEVAALCERVGASIDNVSDGLAMDSRTGSRIIAGVGYGGSCFPKDVRALDHLGLTSDANLEHLRSVITVNNRQRMRPLYAIRDRFNGAISGLRVAVLGLAFKPARAASTASETRTALHTHRNIGSPEICNVPQDLSDDNLLSETCYVNTYLEVQAMLRISGRHTFVHCTRSRIPKRKQYNWTSPMGDRDFYGHRQTSYIVGYQYCCGAGNCRLTNDG